MLKFLWIYLNIYWNNKTRKGELWKKLNFALNVVKKLTSKPKFVQNVALDRLCHNPQQKRRSHLSHGLQL